MPPLTRQELQEIQGAAVAAEGAPVLVIRMGRGSVRSLEPAKHITIKARRPARAPIGRVVGLRAWTVADGTEEDVMTRVGHDAYVAAPDDQIARLRLADAHKTFMSDVEVAGTRVVIRKACPFVERVNEMRAIRVRRSIEIRRGDGSHDVPALRFAQGMDTGPGRRIFRRLGKRRACNHA
jgi:hypothetical protein